jgi:hypothetical protein
MSEVFGENSDTYRNLAKNFTNTQQDANETARLSRDAQSDLKTAIQSGNEEVIRLKWAAAQKALELAERSQELAAQSLQDRMNSAVWLWEPPTQASTLPKSADQPSPSPEISSTTNKLLETIFKALEGFLKKLGFLSDDGKVDQEKLDDHIDKFIDSRKDKEALTEKWATFKEGDNSGLEIQFSKDTKIQLKKTPATEKTPPATPPPIDVKEGKIVLEKGAEITEVKTDTTRTLTVTVLNKDKSTDIYTITGAEKKTEPAPPTPVTATPAGVGIRS